MRVRQIRLRHPIRILMFLILSAAASSATALEPVEKAGKNIFTHGLTEKGAPVAGLFSKDKIRLEGAAVACATCHGYDGLGRSESGLIAPRITPDALFTSYRHLHSNGDEHSPFTDASLKSYLATGRYPGGEEGDFGMPVYMLSPSDANALVAYLKSMQADAEPGVTTSKVVIGTVVPTGGAAGELGNAIEKTLQLYFSEVNSRGGVYGRSLELMVWRNSGEELRSLVKAGDIFALVSPFTPGKDAELAVIAEEGTIPAIGPFTLFPRHNKGLSRHVFYLLPGLGEQMRVLALSAQKIVPAKTKVALVYSMRDDLTEVVHAAEEALSGKSFESVRAIGVADGAVDTGTVVDRFAREGIAALFFLGTEREMAILLAEAEKKKWLPEIFVPGVVIGRDGLKGIPAIFRSRLHIAYPTLPEDRKEWGAGELSALLERGGTAAQPAPAQQSAYAAAKLLVEALRRSGRDLKREKFIAALETTYGFDTGIMPRISFDRNRRIGSLGAYVVSIDPDAGSSDGFITSKEWVSAD